MNRKTRGVDGRPVLRSATLAAIAATAFALVSACSSSSPSAGSSAATSANPYKASLTYWFWGESDIPGIDKWMTGMVSQYQKLHPGVKINVVPQSTNTLIGALNTAAQSKAGPNMATQWATLPTLTPYWNGDTRTNLELCSGQSDRELAEHEREHHWR